MTNQCQKEFGFFNCHQFHWLPSLSSICIFFRRQKKRLKFKDQSSATKLNLFGSDPVDHDHAFYRSLSARSCDLLSSSEQLIARQLQQQRAFMEPFNRGLSNTHHLFGL